MSHPFLSVSWLKDVLSGKFLKLPLHIIPRFGRLKRTSVLFKLEWEFSFFLTVAQCRLTETSETPGSASQTRLLMLERLSPSVGPDFVRVTQGEVLRDNSD